jgi:anaerobic selenocysteine-containing dehydrogenase
VADPASRRQIQTYCGLCIARCGAIATIQGDRFVALAPDPSHPTGQALCAKGRAGPELVYSADRLLHPMKRTRPKGDPDPGWVRIGWDEALDMTAAAMRRIADSDGPEAFAFSQGSGSTTGLADAGGWIRRLMNAYGSPNHCGAMELCGWSRGFATHYTFGVGSVHVGSAGAMPDIANTGCLILWGYNPSKTRLTHATSTVEAVKRGMKLIVIDPRHAGLANKADVWLRVRPGSDGALALGLANLMIARGWYDRDFLRDWSNGPLLVRADTGRLLTERDLDTGEGGERRLAWDARRQALVAYDPTIGRYVHDDADPALEGEHSITTPQGVVLCHTAFTLFARLCQRHSLEAVATTCWIDPAAMEEAARLIWESRPVGYYAYAGHEQHANTSQTARAISLLYALTGSFDQPGGNVLFPAVPSAAINGGTLPGTVGMAKAAGFAERPLGPARWNNVTSGELYRAILDKEPYAIRGLLGFGSNLLLARSDVLRGREALMALEFYAHADLFMSPTAELADVILPVASTFEREALRVGFDVSLEAQSLVQLRQAVVAPQGEARADTEIIFDLAARLGLGEHFWGGDIEAGYQYQIAPSGVSLDALRASPGGMRVPVVMRYGKHAEIDAKGSPHGFPTPSRKVEIYSETFLQHGYDPLPEYREPQVGPVARPDLAARYPLVLTSAKSTLFCDSQHRALPSLRRQSIDPEVELHPDAAQARGVMAGEWVAVETPEGSVRARARLNASLDPRVAVGQHGWWQACATLGAPAYDPFSAEGSNFNLLIGADALDPISGTPPHRAYLCEIRPVGATAPMSKGPDAMAGSSRPPFDRSMYPHRGRFGLVSRR